MRITFQTVRQTQSGFALMLVLTVMAACLVIFASIMYWVTSNAKVTQDNNIFNQSQSAAEGCTENIIATMMRDFNNLALNSSNTYNTLVPPTNGWPISYQFSATNGASGLSAFVSIGPTNWGAVPSQFTGLLGLGQNCIVACTATPLNQPVSVPATVSETIWFGTIPMCQYAVFYNVILEINPGAAFTISGRVHCNTNMYCTGDSSGSPLTFLNSVDCSGTETNNPSPLDPQNYGNRTGNVVFPTGFPVVNTDTLNLPLGTSTTNYSYAAIESLLQLPPATYALGTAAAYTTNGQVYFANKADFIITNDVATGTNITVLYQNQYSGLGPSWVFPVLPDTVGNIITNKIITTNGTVIKYYTTNFVYITNYYYSYVTNATFYDYREGKTVNALQIDVSKLDAWLGSAWLSNNNASLGGWQYEVLNTAVGTSKGNVIDSIYVYNSMAPTTGMLPAVRLVNGCQLPTNTITVSSYTYPAAGLGIATAQPLYVKGDYNVTVDWKNFAYNLGSTTNGETVPAALIGDAVTLLSSNFVDNAAGGTEDPTPGQNYITLNAACFEGVVPSNGSYYSGGLENFLRLLENWSGKTVSYNGSIVVMFPSTYATNHWGGDYYGAPTRAWGFDTTFENPGSQPPIFPNIKGDARYTWTFH